MVRFGCDVQRTTTDRTSDKLFALSDVTGKIQHGSGLSYMARLWKENLVYNLLWFPVWNRMQRPRSHRAPSWSWVSTDSPIRHLFSEGDSLCTYGVSYFKPDDLMEWSEFEEEAKVITTGAELNGCEVPTLGVTDLTFFSSTSKHLWLKLRLRTTCGSNLSTASIRSDFPRMSWTLSWKTSRK
jgi:hypothetical protein